MTKDDKIAFVLNDISNNYNTFIKQADNHLQKHSRLSDSTGSELMSDILFSIIEKLNTTKNINRYYDMALNDRLRFYISKAIFVNTYYFKSPFLRAKFKQNNRYTVIETKDYLFAIQEPTDFDNQDESTKEKMSADLLSMLEYPRAQQVFGEDWKYYTKILKEYIATPECTYKSIAEKYGIPFSSIAFHIRYAKDKIREELNKKI